MDSHATDLTTYREVSSSWEQREDVFKVQVEQLQEPPWRKLPNKLLVVPDANCARRVWQCILYLMLGYTATILPYDLAFLDFAVPVRIEKSPFWKGLEVTVDVLFVIDLASGFFFTYRNSFGEEVKDFWQIVLRYLRTWFFLNMIACIPPNWFGDLAVEVFNIERNSTLRGRANKVLRITRLERISRLARLGRLIRVSRLSALKNSIVDWFWSFRGVRVFNFIVFLAWAAHLMACGWYICAALHDDYKTTWLFRRFDSDLETDPVNHWLTSVYFILTVFTSVGFGDMYAFTTSEMLYLIFTMLVGCVCNGIILSEVINVVTEADQFTQELSRQKNMVQGFRHHVQLSPESSKELLEWARCGVAIRNSYNRKYMKRMLTGNFLPQAICSKLPKALFNGLLLKNRFVLTACHNLLQVPYRLPVLIALAINPRFFTVLETVYHSCDYDWNIYLVHSGVFASVAKPTSLGGISERSDVLQNAQHAAFHGLPSTAKQFTSSIDPTVKFINAKCDTWGYSPYQLYNSGNYFGDVELMIRNQKGRRRSCKRCESKSGGFLLVLAFSDMSDIVDEFPTAFSAWRVIACQREIQRVHLLRKLTAGTDYKYLAAWTIQWHYMEHRRKTGKHSRGRVPKVWGIDLDETDEIPLLTSRKSSKAFTNKGGDLGLARQMSEDSPSIRQLQIDIASLSQRVTTIHDTMNTRHASLEGRMTKVHNKLDLLIRHLIPNKACLSL